MLGVSLKRLCLELTKVCSQDLELKTSVLRTMLYMIGGLLKNFLWEESRFNAILKDIPLHVVVGDKVGLLGAREVAAKAMRARQAIEQAKN